MDHDHLFKELLRAFFVEFIELFLPDMAKYLDASSLEFLDKEVFTDITSGESHEVDLIVKTRFQEKPAFFLVHVESQSSAEPDFPNRMFRYFARLHEKYALPVYPVVIFSYDAPKRLEPNHYVVAFPGKTVLQFTYTVIQLNRLPWRRFVKQPNPVATALMTRMKMSQRDRPKVKLECLRLLATLKLNPARSKLIGRFIDGYLNLTSEEIKRYEREFAKLAPEDQERTMGMVSSWEAKGMHTGKEELVSRLIRRRFGSVPEQVTTRLDQLSNEQLDDLGEALLDFTSMADLETWLSARQ